MTRHYYDMTYQFRPKLAKSSLGKNYPHQPRIRYYTYHDSDTIGALGVANLQAHLKKKYYERKTREAFDKAMQRIKGEND